MNIMLIALALIAGSGIAIAQTVVPSHPNSLTKPAASAPIADPAGPTTSQARDGVRNGTTKKERDQHNEPRPGAIDKPVPEPQR
jgi:hypothetical protein